MSDQILSVHLQIEHFPLLLNYLRLNCSYQMLPNPLKGQRNL
ncbi:hypothetical protein [Salinibacter phage 8_2]